MAEAFGVQGRGALYDQTGTIRDIIQNHLFQVLANLTMEPPVGTDSESLRDEKVKILKAIRPIEASDLVRGQFRGYRSEDGVAPDSSQRRCQRSSSSPLARACARCRTGRMS
jgi:glucose-6-phosphate 1-dehydrogenase